MARRASKRRSAERPTAAEVDRDVERIGAMGLDALRALWRNERGGEPPATLSKDLLARALSHRLQEARLGGLSPQLRRLLVAVGKSGAEPVRHLKVGSVIVREHQGVLHEVMVVPDGLCWNGRTYSSLSAIALKITGSTWNGPRFFGLRAAIEEPTNVPTKAHEAPHSSQSSIKARPLPRGQHPIARPSEDQGTSNR